MKAQNIDVREGLLFALWNRKILHFNDDFQNFSQVYTGAR